MWLRFRAKIVLLASKKNTDRIEIEIVPEKSTDLARSK